MFRGRGTPNHQRKSGGGDAKISQDYRGSQVGQKPHPLFGASTPGSQDKDNRFNRSGGGGSGYKNDVGSASRGTRKDIKSDPGTPLSTNKAAPLSNSHASSANRTGGGNPSKDSRPRSRSPISRGEGGTERDKPIGQVDAEVEIVEDKPEEEKKTFRYCGRPGEKKFSGRCRLFVANLSNGTTEEELKTLFGEFGECGEIYVNKEKGFGFIRLDYRHNAEIAKLTLDKKMLNGRNIQVRYATHASAIELHGLDNYASNEFIEQAMSTFGAVERCIIVCDDRGRSKGYAIVEFEWKKSAAKVLDRLKDEMFCLGRLPKPVFAKPFIIQDEEEGIKEESLERLEGIEAEREAQPRFINPNSFEYTWAKRWRDLFIEEQDKKARLEQELTDARCKLEFEMEAAIRQQEASKIREDLARRQEELRMLEEDMMRRQEADMRILERSRQRELSARQGRPEQSPRDEAELHQQEMQLSRENAARQQDFNSLRQRAEMKLSQDSSDYSSPGNRSDYGRPSPGGQQQGYQRGGHPGGHPGGPQQGGQRQQMHPGAVMDYRNQQQQRGPPRDQRELMMQQREMQQREMLMQQREMQQREMQKRDGQQRDGQQRDGQQRDGQQRDGPQRDGPQRDGPQRDGPQRDGPQRDGPQRDGPQRDGPQRDGPQRDGPPSRDVPSRDLPPPRDLPAREIARESAQTKDTKDDKSEGKRRPPATSQAEPTTTKTKMPSWEIF